MPLRLRNPHSIIAVLDNRPEDIHWIALPEGGGNEAWQIVVEKAYKLRISVRSGSAAREVAGARKKRHSSSKGETKFAREGIGSAQVTERSPIDLHDLFPITSSDTPGLWLALDCVQDPRNVGAIFRTAAFFNIQGIILMADRAAPLSDVTYDVAAGGLEYVPFAIVTNLRAALEKARDTGLWILGTSENADQDISEIDRTRSWLFVVGNEERGIRRLTLENCDQVCRITPKGRILSLNVSVAAAICMSEFTK
jgi:23S rRNA (guanosine2251-2'-O)-methyltransferase